MVQSRSSKLSKLQAPEMLLLLKQSDRYTALSVLIHLQGRVKLWLSVTVRTFLWNTLYVICYLRLSMTLMRELSWLQLPQNRLKMSQNVSKA